jgi:lysophospholipase L1-like esterase
LDIPRPITVAVTAEKYEALPLFRNDLPGWAKGIRLHGVLAQECSTPGLLDPASMQVVTGFGVGQTTFGRGKDFEIDANWGTVGRLPGGRIGERQVVWISYRHGTLRIDSIVLDNNGHIVPRPGQPRAAAPLPPTLEKGDRLLANVWIPGCIERLDHKYLFPILETVFPETPASTSTPAEEYLPKTARKLHMGQSLRILAWGDSVTVGTFVPDYQKNRWQEQFVARLHERFPQAKITLLTEAWGGRNTASYLAEPPGSEHNYREKVLGAKPDLVISEFVNDAGLNPEQVEERYSSLLLDFQRIGAEWIILTPHYVRPDWMGLDREREIDEDPRPYVAGLRQFVARHKVALADASLRYGRLWRQGLPYSTLMLNSINHPDARGMKLFADSLMALFQ